MVSIAAYALLLSSCKITRAVFEIDGLTIGSTNGTIESFPWPK